MSYFKGCVPNQGEYIVYYVNPTKNVSSEKDLYFLNTILINSIRTY